MGDDGSSQAGAWVLDTYGRPVHATLLDVLAACDMAARLVAAGRAAYEQEEMSRLAAEAISLRIGEAVGRLPETFVTAHPNIEWHRIRGMRNIVAHEHGRVDHRMMWNALERRMPEVAVYVADLLGR